MPDAQPFALGEVLTVTTGRLLTASSPQSKNGIDRLYTLLEHLTGDPPYTHQLPRFMEECRPWLLRWFPELASVNAMLLRLDALLTVNPKTPYTAIAIFLNEVQREPGARATYDVPSIPRDDHDSIDPLIELEAMVGRDRIIVVQPEDSPHAS